MVSLSHRYNRKIEGLICLVQSNVQCPEYIYNKINKFFDDFNLTDENNLTDEDFKSHVDAIIINLKQKDLTLGEEVDRNFGEIKIRECAFTRDPERIKIYETEIKKQDVIDFYEEHFIRNVRRFDIELVSPQHRKDNEKFLAKNLKSGESQEDESATQYPTRVEVKYEDVLKRMCELYPDYYYYIKK
jgi:secreted Zn-dependent insulinase-like peptidase